MVHVGRMRVARVRRADYWLAMTANEQAFTGFGAFADTTSEYNRLSFLVRSIMADQATTTVVRVVEVDGDRVSVQPMVSQVDGAGNAIDHGIIHDLPVWRLQGGNSAIVVSPAVDDIGIAIFASTDISNVKRARAPSTPGSARRFNWSDGIYLGGILNAAPTQFVRMDAAGVYVKSEGLLPVKIEAQTVEIVGNLTVSGSVTSGPGSSFGGTAFDTHAHLGVTTGSGTSGPPA